MAKKVAILGSAPSSLGLAPFGDPSWDIWGCSPGVYHRAARCTAWFELHRWEPGQIGNAASQKTWFSPEYVAWMALRDPKSCPVWMYDAVPQIPASRRLPIEDLTSRYGTFFFTSSVAIMIACAIEEILEARANGDNGQHVIGLFGVDMAANEEYGYQRAGCQHFLLLAGDLGIHVHVPPESDLLRPMPIYGICESSHWHIKNLVRQGELNARLQQAIHAEQQAHDSAQFLRGALDDLNYQMLTWGEDRTGMGVAPSIVAQGPRIREDVIANLAPAGSNRTPPPNGERHSLRERIEDLDPPDDVYSQDNSRA